MKTLYFILINLIFVVCESHYIKTTIDDYIEMVLIYYRERNVHILTHFTCFSTSKCFKVIFICNFFHLSIVFFQVIMQKLPLRCLEKTFSHVSLLILRMFHTFQIHRIIPFKELLLTKCVNQIWEFLSQTIMQLFSTTIGSGCLWIITQPLEWLNRLLVSFSI